MLTECNKRQKTDGFTLIETLVALLIISIGLTGLAKLQLYLAQQSQASYQHTQAILLAQTITEQRRVNPNANLTTWQQIISQRLSAGEATVCLDSTPQDGMQADTAECDQQGPLYVAKLWWNHDRDPATEKQRLNLSFAL
jgi:type IV pilus assembly protein PilV